MKIRTERSAVKSTRRSNFPFIRHYCYAVTIREKNYQEICAIQKLNLSARKKHVKYIFPANDLYCMWNYIHEMASERKHRRILYS